MTREQRQADSIAGVEARDYICKRRPQLRRWAVGIARKIHHSGLALRDHVIAGPVSVRAGVTETGNGTINRARVYLCHCRVSKSKFVQNAGPEVLNENIGSLNQLPQNAA